MRQVRYGMDFHGRKPTVQWRGAKDTIPYRALTRVGHTNDGPGIRVPFLESSLLTPDKGNRGVIRRDRPVGRDRQDFGAIAIIRHLSILTTARPAHGKDVETAKAGGIATERRWCRDGASSPRRGGEVETVRTGVDIRMQDMIEVRWERDLPIALCECNRRRCAQ